MATMNRTGERSRDLREAARPAVEPLPSNARMISSRQRGRGGDHWLAGLVALAMATVLAGVAAFGGLVMVAPGPVPSPHERADVSTTNHGAADAGQPVSWGERRCCHETQ